MERALNEDNMFKLFNNNEMEINNSEKCVISGITMPSENMNNKGFTIVELVAIILILAAILLVSFPIIQNIEKTDNDKKYNTMVKNLCLAGKSYINANEDSFEELNIVGGEIIIEISELVVYGSVKDNIKNPKTGKRIIKDSLKFTALQDFELDCEYIEN